MWKQSNYLNTLVLSPFLDPVLQVIQGGFKLKILLPKPPIFWLIEVETNCFEPKGKKSFTHGKQGVDRS